MQQHASMPIGIQDWIPRTSAASKSRDGANSRTAGPVIAICMREAAAELPSKRSIIFRIYIAYKTTGPESVGVTNTANRSATDAGRCVQERTDAQPDLLLLRLNESSNAPADLSAGWGYAP